MNSPKGKSGFVRIENKILDEVIRRDFTKRQKDILLFIWRLSYGCRRDVAYIPKLKDFTLCGVGKGHIGAELRELEQCKVITRNNNEYRFNEEYDFWQITPVRGWDGDRFNELIHLNIVESKKQSKKVTETGTTDDDDSQDVSHQNGVFVDDEKSPKQEPDNDGKVTETVTNDEKKLLKQGHEVTETVTLTPLKPLGDAGYSRSTDILQTVIITDSKDIFETVVSYLNLKTGKSFSHKSKETVKYINGRLSEGRTLEDFKYVIDVKVAEWQHKPDMAAYLRPSTLFRPSNFENYLNQAPPTKTAAQGNSRAERNKALLQQKMAEVQQRDREGNTEFIGGYLNGIPND